MPILLLIIAIGFFLIAILSLFPQTNNPALMAVSCFLSGAALIVIGYGGR